MFSWLRGGGSGTTRNATLFDDLYSIVDIENIRWKKRTTIDADDCVRLCANTAKSPQSFVYYEVVYELKDRALSFLVYHSLSLREARQVYDDCKRTLNELSKYLPANKLAIVEDLRQVMESLRINPRWTCAHVCARLGFDSYFAAATASASPTPEGFTPNVNPNVSIAINAQCEPDLYTPLHLAIKALLLPTVKLILALSPNLDLLNAKRQSVLHYAAVSTQEIIIQILAQPGMFDRILWRDAKGCTALHMACYIQKFDIVFEFLKFGLTVRMLTLSPPNSRSNRSNTTITRTTVTTTTRTTAAASKITTDQNQHDKNINNSNNNRKAAMNEVVNFCEQDFDDIDCQDIFSGGCPLHWVKHKRLMEKLLKFAFPINVRNANGDTPLHVVSKRLRLKCMLSLLCAGANVNANNIFGNTPLHLSVKENDLVVPQTLIVFDANIDARNYSDESVRHVAARSCKSTGNEAILYLLTALGAKRCPLSKDKDACNIGCSFNGDFEGNITEKLYGVDQKYDRLYKEFLFEDLIRQNLARKPEQMAEQRGVNMLCMDGGGIKGLISLQLLKEIDHYLKHPLHCYFKWFAGTSTGSFICAFLSMGKSLNQIRSIYFSLKDKVLTGARPYTSESFENLIMKEVGIDIKMEDILTRYDKYLIIPSVIANRRPMKLHLFRSFPSVQELFEGSGDERLVEQLLPDRDKDLKNYKKYENLHMEVWKACRASGAAPTYFRAFGDFLDGGVASNNPTLDALAEFEQRNAALRTLGRGNECPKLDLVVSIGTGKGLIEESDMVDIDSYGLRNIRQFRTLINLFIYEICQTEQHIVQRAESFCAAAGIPFFRLNSFLSDLMEIDEQQDYKVINCLWETKRFMYYRRDQVKVLVNYLEKCTQNLPNKSSKGRRAPSKWRASNTAKSKPNGALHRNSTRRNNSVQKGKSLNRPSKKANPSFEKIEKK